MKVLGERPFKSAKTSKMRQSPFSRADCGSLGEAPPAITCTLALKMSDQAYSIWRPLRRVEDWPVAVCDGRTTKESDLVAADNIRRDFVGENMFAKHNPDYRWYYLPDQEKDEVLLIKIHDSSLEVESRCKPPLKQSMFRSQAPLRTVSLSTRSIQAE